jgi:hypothetical protein
MYLNLRAFKCYLLFFIFVSFQTQALSKKQVFEELNQLIKNKQYESALTFSDEYIFDYAGEPTFDFLIGIAAVKVGKYQQAVFALERTVIVRPKWKLARFNLAKSYFYIDNLLAAKNELNKLQPLVTDKQLKQTISAFLDRIEQSLLNKQKKLTQLLGITIGHDSNINSGAILDEFESPLLNQPIQLSQESQKISDEALYLNYQLRYQTPINQNKLIISEVALFHTDYKESDNNKFQSSIAQISTKYQDTWSWSTFQVGAYFRPLLLNSAMYRHQYGMETSLIIPLNKTINISMQLGLGNSIYSSLNELDSRDLFVGFGTQYRKDEFWHQVQANISKIDATTTDSDYNSYKLYLMQYQTSYFISQFHEVNFLLQYQGYNYKGIHPFWLEVRDESLYRGSLSWRYYLEDNWTWQLSIKHAQKKSNLPIYEYDRNEVSFGLMKQF